MRVLTVQGIDAAGVTVMLADGMEHRLGVGDTVDIGNAAAAEALRSLDAVDRVLRTLYDAVQDGSTRVTPAYEYSAGARRVERIREALVMNFKVTDPNGRA